MSHSGTVSIFAHANIIRLRWGCVAREYGEVFSAYFVAGLQGNVWHRRHNVAVSGCWRKDQAQDAFVTEIEVAPRWQLCLWVQSETTVVTGGRACVLCFPFIYAPSRVQPWYYSFACHGLTTQREVQ